MVMKVEEIRRWNTRAIADRAGGVAAFSRLIGRAQAQVSHVIGKNPIKPIEAKLARYIESMTKDCDEGWLDTPHVREWLAIQNPQWAAALRLELAQYGETVDAGRPASGPEVELLTLYNLMGPREQRQLLQIARVLHGDVSPAGD